MMVSYLSSKTSGMGYWDYFISRMKKERLNYKRFRGLENIIKNKSISTFFQPIVGLQNGQNLGYEVLNRPPSSSIFPSTGEFYEFIGKTNQVFSFEHFCRAISLERYVKGSAGKAADRNSYIFLNVHPKVLMDSNYKSGETVQLLKKLGIAPNQIVFELTEREAVTNFNHFVQVLKHYRSQGFRIAVDDAGSGYNSLKTLAYIKPEFIKLDMSLIKNIDNSKVSQQLVTMLLEFSRQSSTYVIAEGIERIEEFYYLRGKGVDFGQGYLLGKPKNELRPGLLP
ncbi:EAL domain-containing protein [Alteribacillus iranensis]|uniref:EAL domain, c-di-GMP-specific phosphodiesterase class I (Or its enzymatically inactive variant) n=1 Tax=Alteribacillus iranensis TaxID=930128 RepID=A0A1I2E6I4_9BACI|nr:EAL domain-containing protein [Alteribacillus iranensis]SFE88574.1 EAL domain, c-di-GMP-specific phosphodiesterase class I (or its enzymatically inactive variant) [Alteribacillus iranensis]